MHQKRKKGLLLLLLMLLAACLFSLFAGLVGVSPVHFFLGKLTPLEENVLWNLRLPRLLLGLGAGSALAVSGAVLQGIFGNPLADPGLLGVSGGGALGAVAVLLLGLPQKQYLFLPLGAFLGALLASGTVGALGRRGGSGQSVRLLLAGAAVSLFCGALTAGLLFFSPETVLRQYFFWTLGGLSSGTWQQVHWILPPLFAVLLLLCLWGRQLNVLSLGEEQALAVGMDAGRWRNGLLAVVSLLLGLAVCAGGNIGFIGLMVPHILRLQLGPDHRFLLPLSALGGAGLLTFCDSLGRLVVPGTEVRVGVITSLLGAPYFLFLLRKHL